MLGHDCKPSHLYDVIHKERGFIRSIKNSEILPQDIKDAINGDYVPSSNKQTLQLAQEIIAQDRSQAIAMVLTEKNPSALTYAIGQDLLRQLQQGTDWEIEASISIAEHLAETATAKGQAIQALSMFNRLTPEGALRYATRVAKRNKKKLTPEKVKRIQDKARELRDVKNKNERDVKTGELMSEIQDLENVTFGQKISTLQTMAQLLNPKTAIRNILGNALFGGFETASQVVGTVLDSAIAPFTGKRSTVLPQISAASSGFNRGIKSGVNDALKGIDTSQGGNKFDLGKGRTFKAPILKDLETAMNLELRATDRAFYEMAYRSSLIGQVKALRASKEFKGRARITDEMKAVAHQDALYKTFQDDSAAAKIFTGIKKALNLKQDFGLGDFVLKYPKTPANLLSRAFAYSPAGFLKAFYEIGKPLIQKSSGAQFDQKAFVDSFSRAITGTIGVGAMGYALGKMGLATGEYGVDKDIEAAKKLQGFGPYKLNASGITRFATTLNPEQAAPQEGDVWFSYDWAQPIAVPLSAGVNIAIKPVDNETAFDLASQVASGVFEGAETLTQQNVVRGLQDLFNVRDEDGKPNIIAGLQNVASGAPASFIPSILNQTQQLADNSIKETYDPDPVKNVLNKMLAKIPFAAETLPAKYDTYGKPLERYQDGSNDLFNVFLNPAFVSKLKADPVGQEILGIYSSTGEVKQAAREVPKSVQVKRGGKSERIKLTGAQISEYQQVAGQQTKIVFERLLESPRFQRLSDEERADVMSSVLTDIHTAAKMALFNHQPSKPSKRIRYMRQGNERAYMNSLNQYISRKQRD